LARYIHQLRSWPGFSWDRQGLTELLASVHLEQGRLLGRMEHLGCPLQQEAEVTTLTEDVVKTSEIEGENLNPDTVRSSVARHLGIELGGYGAVDRAVEGVVEMMLDATQRYAAPLTEERLLGWHTSLFPPGRGGLRIAVGRWRDDASGPMQVVSGPVGRRRVHFEAPAAKRLPREMNRFLAWYNDANEQDWVIKAALAHLWFVTIHPLDDGNGRIARAIADMSLARSEKSPQRFYSMSAQIRRERAAYYRVLEQTQRATMDVTPWMEWFFGCLKDAIEGARGTLASVVGKTRLWESIESMGLNDRQKLVLHRLMNAFEGKLTSSKWAKLAKCSQDTATRDIHDLVAKGVLQRNEEGGRSTSYSLITPVVRADHAV